MRIANWRIVVDVAWISMILAGQVLAQGTHVADRAVQLESEEVAPQALTPATTAGVPMGEPTVIEDGQLFGEDQPYVDAVFGGVAPGCEICGGGSCRPPAWSVENNLRFLQRTRSRNIFISESVTNGFGAIDLKNSTDPNVDQVRFVNQQTAGPLTLQINNLNFEPEPSYDLKISHHLGQDADHRDRFIDFEFWGFSRWESSESAAGTIIPYIDETRFYTLAQASQPGFFPIVAQYTGSLISPFKQVTAGQVANGVATADDLSLSVAFNNALSHEMSFESSIDSYEVNYRFVPRSPPDQLVLDPNGRWYRRCRPGVYCSYFFGLRAIFEDEKFEFISRGVSFSGTNQANDYLKNGRYVIRTHNDLLGVQLGGQLTLRRCRWDLDVHGKVVPSLNFAEQQSHVQTNAGVHLGQTSSASNAGATPFYDARWQMSRGVAGILGEFGFGGRYIFRPGWTGRAAYDFMWLGGIASAPDQIVFQANPAPALNSTGTIFMHGLTLGLERSW